MERRNFLQGLICLPFLGVVTKNLKKEEMVITNIMDENSFSEFLNSNKGRKALFSTLSKNSRGVKAILS